MKIIFVFVLSALLAGAAFAFDYADQQLGSRIGAIDARSAAMGGVSSILTDTPTSLGINPALSALSSKKLTASAGVILIAQREARARPTFDTFDDINYYNEYALNEELYSRFYFAAQYQISQSFIPALSIGLAFLPRTSQDYRYKEEVRGTFTSGGLSDQVLGYNTIETTGGTNAVVIAAAAKPADNWAFGLSLSVLTGSSESTRRTDYIDESAADSTSGWIRSFDSLPVELTIGLAYNYQQRVLLGLSITPSLMDHSIRIEDRDTGDVIIRDETQPTIATIGIAYQPVNPIRTTVVFEARAEFWSQYKLSEGETPDSVKTPDLDDIIILGVGIEHRVLPEVPLRLGFNYRPSPADPDLANTIFTFGTGMNLTPESTRQGGISIHLDLTGQIGARSYYFDDLFPESLFNGTDYDGEDRVQEKTFRAFATLTISK